MGSAPHDDEDGISDEEKSDSDPEEAYTAVRSVVSIPKQAAEEAQEYPKVAELKERPIKAYPRLLKPVRTPVAILGSLGVCIYAPASRHCLISYSPIHLN